MKSPPIFTVDLDSTLCDTQHRQAMLPSIDQRWDYDWSLYSAHCANDSPVEGVVRAVELLALTMPFIVVSARTTTVASLTKDWLVSHVQAEPFRIVLNDVEGIISHSEYKAWQISRLQEEGFDVRLHIDDWPPVEDSLKPLNVPCLIVSPPQDKCKAHPKLGNP